MSRWEPKAQPMLDKLLDGPEPARPRTIFHVDEASLEEAERAASASAAGESLLDLSDDDADDADLAQQAHDDSGDDDEHDQHAARQDRVSLFPSDDEQHESGASASRRAGDVASSPSSSSSGRAGGAASTSRSAASARRQNFRVIKLLEVSDASVEPPAELTLTCFADRHPHQRAPASSAAAAAARARQQGLSNAALEANACALDLFRLESTLTLPRETLARSPFFRKKLDGAWKRAYHVTIKLPRFGAVQALCKALEYLVTGDVDFAGRFLFELLAVSHFLKLERLRHVCATRIGATLNHRNIVVASHFAHRCGIGWLLDACYTWIVRHLVETQLLGEMLGLNTAAQHGKTYVNLALRHGPYSVPLAAFAPVFQSMCSEARGMLQHPVQRFVGSVVREKFLGEHAPPVYNLFMEGVKHPVLRARLCPDEGEYVVSVSQDLADLVWHGKQSVGHVRSNMTGTLFTVFDVGVRADFNEAVFPVRQRTDRCVIKYKRNILGAVPREFQVIVPREPEPLLEEAPMGPAGSSFKFPVPAPRPPPIEGKHKGSARRSVMVLENKKPVWNDALGAYTLDFGEAVKLPSKKNFQLVDRDEPDGEVRLMFGKVRRNHFYIDFCAPLSPLTAFGIILSSFDKKRFVT